METQAEARDEAQRPAFGARLRAYRVAAGLTQEALAERAGLSVRGIKYLERGARQPYPDTVHRLAAALALDAAERATFLAARQGEHHGGQGRGAAGLGLTHTTGTGPALPGSAPPPLIGRAAERALLERHLAGAGPPALLLAGEPGIGKSRLLQEASPQAVARGWRVLAGGCQRRDGQEPYAPLLQALERHIAAQRPSAVQAQLQGCAWLVRLLPELADGPIPPLPLWTLSPKQERRLMVEAVIRFLTNVAGPAGTLLVLDDLQWAGPDALTLLETLVRVATTIPLRVVGAYRDTEAGLNDPLASMLADLAHAGLAAQHTLTPLTAAESGQLLGWILDDEPEERKERDTLREQIVQRTGGVPFFLLSCAQTLRRDRGAEGRQAAVPWDVGHSVRQRVAALSAGAREVLAVAAVVGRVVPHAVLTAACRGPGGRVAAAQGECCRARLLEEAGADAYRFAHDLIREVVEADLGASQRLLLHGRIAHRLERGRGPSPDVEVLAYHYSRSEEHDKALLYLELAGDRARDRYAHEAAAAYYSEVAARLDRVGRAHAAARMREQVGVLLQTAGQYAQSLELLEQAAEAYEAAGDLEGLGRVVASIGKGYMLAGTSVPLQRLEQTRARLEERGVGRSLAVLCARLSELYYCAGRCDDQLAMAERAVDVARHAGDDRLLADARATRAWALVCQGRQEDALPDLEEVIRLAESSGQLAILCDALQTAAGAYGDRGEVERQRAYSDRAVATAERLGDPAVLVLMLAIHGLLAFFHGDWGQARADCERALAVSRGTPSRLEMSLTAVPHVGPKPAGELALAPSVAPPWWAMEGMPRLYLGQLCLAEGDLQAAAHHLEAARACVMADVHDVVLVETLLAHRDLLAGRPAAACARLAPLATQPGPREGWEWQVTPLLVLLAWAHLDLGEVAQATSVAAQAVRQARAAQFPRALVEALWMQARVATRQERWAQARRALDEGLALARRIQYPYGEARLLQVYGTLPAPHAEPDKARQHLEAALAIFRRLGARTDAKHVEHAIMARDVESLA